MTDTFAGQVVCAAPIAGGGGSGGDAVFCGIRDPSVMQQSAAPTGMIVNVDAVSKTLDWWSEKAVKTDAEEYRLEMEGRRYCIL